MNCPRCGGTLVHRAFETEGGYRAAVTMRELDECPTCRLAVLSGAVVVLDETQPPVPLRRTPLVREAVRTGQPCPSCAFALTGLTLAWADEVLALESCEPCDLVVVDRGELDRVEHMLDDAAELHTTDLQEVAEGVRDASAELDALALERPIRRFLRRLHLL